MRACLQQQGQHPLRERAKKLDQGILVIRFEMPFNVWCQGCGHLIGKGVRFNAEKQAIGNYHSTKIWSFSMTAPCCQQRIVVHTDPKTTEYLVVSGGRRKVLLVCTAHWRPWRSKALMHVVWLEADLHTGPTSCCGLLVPDVIACQPGAVQLQLHHLLLSRLGCGHSASCGKSALPWCSPGHHQSLVLVTPRTKPVGLSICEVIGTQLQDLCL